MSEEKTILTIMTEVYCNDKYAEKPSVAVIYLTQKKLDRYRHLSEVAKTENVRRIQDFDECAWPDSMPLLTFKELENTRVYLCETRDMDYHDEPGEDALDMDPSCERIDCELVNVETHGFFFMGYGKHSGTMFESEQVSFAEIDKALTEEPMSPEKYFFQRDDGEVPTLVTAPTLINDTDYVKKHYATELLKRGNQKEGS
jgi:hypothetical protein